MKKIRILIVLTLLSFLGYCQSGKVIYSNKTYIDPNIEIKSNIKSYIKELYDKADKIKFELNFSNQKSSFRYLSNNMKDDDRDNVTARLVIYGENVYCDHKNKLELHVDTDNTLIKDSYIVKGWTITNESKKIDAYLCFKAIYKYSFINRKGKNKIAEVIAWFAPSLPYAFGPKNFYGLPGLILELTENNTTYLATKIQLSDKAIEIKFPKGKAISREEYNNKMKAQFGR